MSISSDFLFYLYIVITVTGVFTVDTFVGGVEEAAELGATPGGRFLHEPIGHLLLAGASAGAFAGDVISDVGEAADVAEVGLKTAAERDETVASLGDDDHFVVRTNRSKLLQFAVFTRLYTTHNG